ncbi:Lyzozyme M1 (1,4-beta-N-acetylmuramidase) [Companilactobacillus farciminis KCTC 3681 = DSM 20184]|nr:Lyzozyme M1 (1,4-beta-N-acetylmuramidase) [Companilactobacillus farciminis KCTC 3681 = DSM 20184]
MFLGATKVSAARADMVDVSNNNGAMTVANFQDMHDNYGVKAVVTKISEGTSFKDSTAANNIATAQQAGMYINGYHFARYNSVASAIAEADYAGKLAQADGLPAGAVLATDVESSEQSSVSEAQNDADNQAFMKEVAKYGYRSTIYTMGSWVGSVMSVDSGWIASYPYDPTDQEWYTSNHGWQWSSSYTFNGSYGNFDVSELYDNFFTTYKTPTGTSTTTTTTSDDNSATTNSSSSNVGVIEVNNSSSSYVPLMALQVDGSMKTITNRALSNNTSWQTDQTKVVDGTTYYRVATNEWVAEQYLANNSSTTNAASDANVIKVNNANSSYVQLVALQTDGSMKTITNRALANNTSWQTDQTKVVDGTTYYRVATNEWINAEYII